jgi:hypothetical protein
MGMAALQPPSLRRHEVHPARSLSTSLTSASVLPAITRRALLIVALGTVHCPPVPAIPNPASCPFATAMPSLGHLRERALPHEKLAASAFGPVLGFARRSCLPVHVARGVRSAALQRLDVIDDIAGAPPARPASGRARMLLLEGVLGGGCSTYRLWGV